MYITAAAGAVLAALGIVFTRPVAELLGGEGDMLEKAPYHAHIVLLALPFNVLQNALSGLCTTAEKPGWVFW